MNKIINKSLLIILLAGLLSCQKKEVVPVTEDNVDINIKSPESGATYRKGDTVLINAEITYTGQMHGYIARIKNDKDSVLYETEGHSHGDKIDISEQWINSLNTHENLKLEVVAVISHDNYEKTDNVSFISQP